MTKTMRIEDLIGMLHKEQCSCVIHNAGETSMCHRRGVKDLYELLADNPARLRGGMIADKVIGKGAAAILAVGEIRAVYADVISRPALDLLKNMSGIEVSYGTLADNIINRSNTGLCPVEQLCLECTTPQECVRAIEIFINTQDHQK